MTIIGRLPVVKQWCSFRPITNNNIVPNSWVRFSGNNFVVLLAEHNLTEKDIVEAVGLSLSIATSTYFFIGSAACRVHYAMHDFGASVDGCEDQAFQEFKTTRKISGHVALIEDKLVWISRYDVNLLEDKHEL